MREHPSAAKAAPFQSLISECPRKVFIGECSSQPVRIKIPTLVSAKCAETRVGHPGERFREGWGQSRFQFRDREWLRSSTYLGDKLHWLHFGQVDQLFDRQTANDCLFSFSDFSDLQT